MNDPRTSIPAVLPLSVHDATIYESDLGPWPTKSGGSMNVLFGFDQSILERMQRVDPDELALAPQLQLGIRAFHTSGLATGTIGGKHFHRIKQEIITLTRGKVSFTLEDVYGGHRTVTLDTTKRAMYIPPFVMHTYTCLKPPS